MERYTMSNTDNTDKPFELDWENIAKNRTTVKKQIRTATVVTGDIVEEDELTKVDED